MSGSVNKVLLVGNVGKDPEVRFTSDGGKVASFSLATSEYWKDKATGERKDRTEWHKVVIFNDRLVDVVERFIRKGSKLFIEGQLQTRKWTDQQGHDRYTTEVVLSKFKGDLTMLESRNDAATSAAEFESSGANSPAALGVNEFSSSSSSSSSHALDDEIPF